MVAVAAALTVCLATLGGPSIAEAGIKKCPDLTLKLNKRSVAAGGHVWAYGRVCRQSGRSAGRVTFMLNQDGRNRRIGAVRARAGGRFIKRLRIPQIGRRHGVLRAVARFGHRHDGRISAGRAVRLRTRPMVASAKKVKEAGESRTTAVTSAWRPAGSAPDSDPKPARHPGSAPDSTPSPDSACPLNRPDGEVGMVLRGCRLVASDSAAVADPVAFWGAIECEDSSRYRHFSSGGDFHPAALGQEQSGAYRRTTAFDGDDFWGERCELGRNDHRTGPTTFYHEGQRRATYVSIRLPDNFDLATNRWQTVLQMKQAQPAANGGGGPILELQAFNNRWILANDWEIIWTAPARKDTWTRFAIDASYSQYADRGFVQISVDLDGDGSFDGSGERSEKIVTSTLKAETAPGVAGSGLAPGDSIPSHLRAGVYHHSDVSCPAPVGCSADIANVQVVAPGA